MQILLGCTDTDPTYLASRFQTFCQQLALSSHPYQGISHAVQLWLTERVVLNMNLALIRIKEKVKNFLLRDTWGDVVGNVKDVTQDEASTAYFNIIVEIIPSHPQPHENAYLYLLSSRYLSGIDVPTRSLFSKFSKEKLYQLFVPQPTPLEEVDIPLAKVGTKGRKEVPQYAIVDSLSSLQVSRVNPSPIPESNIVNQKPMPDQVNQFDSSEVETPSDLNLKSSDHHLVRLMEERLVVGRQRRKVGEIVIRKTIETRMVEVPIRREKLIVEQIGSSEKPLAEIDIGLGEVTGLTPLPSDHSPMVVATFHSLKTVVQVLDLLFKTTPYSSKRIRIELLLGNGEVQQTYHEFTSLKVACQMMEAIADPLQRYCRTIRVEVALEEQRAVEIFQQWFDRYSSF